MSVVACLLLLLLPLAAAHVIGGGLNTDFDNEEDKKETQSDWSIPYFKALFNKYLANRYPGGLRGDQYQSLLNDLYNKFLADIGARKKPKTGNVLETMSLNILLSKSLEIERARNTLSEPEGAWKWPSDTEIARNKFSEIEGTWGDLPETDRPRTYLEELSGTKTESHCSWPGLLKENVKQLSPAVNVDDVFYFPSDDTALDKMPASDENSNSTTETPKRKCSSIVIKDIGSDFFPRYVKSQQCHRGIESRVRILVLTMYQKLGCKNGYAVVGALIRSVELTRCVFNKTESC
ncbi:hypothetical protein Btru_051715 [Bulinus truncatus]|nr:hypothetical protein Btru_051715 [Bulinus truncatus]